MGAIVSAKVTASAGDNKVIPKTTPTNEKGA